MADRTASVARPRGNLFFVGIALAMLAVAALGFGPSFYLRPFGPKAPLPMHVVVHGAVMTLWYLVFLLQAVLVARGARGLHRQLGMASLLLAAAVVVTGANVLLGWQPASASGSEELARGLGFVVEGLASLLPLVVLVALAVWRRRDAASHKRLMYWAFVWTLGPALSASRPFGRFLDTLVAPHLPFFPFDLLWLAALLAFDWITLRRIHPVTWLGFLLLALYFLVLTPWIASVPLLREGVLQLLSATG